MSIESLVFAVEEVLAAQSCPTLCDPMDCRLPGSSARGILQARILEGLAIPFSRGSSWPSDQTCVSCMARQVLYHVCWVSLLGCLCPRFLWSFIGTLPHLFIYFYDCHHAPKVELSVCDNDCIASKASDIDYLALYEKRFSASFLSHCIY